ncbi:MAG: hypothetical protein J0I09_01030 [Sphingobacteriia bacterium]|nr:hypothetical protein [Sphingobacteriia bacterium]
MQLSTVFRKNTDSAVAAIIGYVIVLLLTRHGGVGISPDSVTYIAAARNLLEGKFLIGHDNTPVVLFPAVYPFFLSGMMKITGADILQFACVLNGGLFALLIFLCGTIMQHFMAASTWYKRTLLFCLCFSPSLLEVFTMLWSETLFIVWILIFIIVMFRFYQTSSSYRLIILLFVVAIAPVIRYAGVSIVVTACMFLLIQRNISAGKKALNIFFTLLAGCSLLAFNLYRNLLVAGTVTGLRQKGITSLFTNIKYVGLVFCDWLPFIKSNQAFAVGLTLFFLAAATAIFAYRYFSNQDTKSYEFIITGFFLAYCIFIIVIATISRFETLNNRIISPLYICWLWCFTCFIPSVIRIIEKRSKKILTISILFVLVFLFQLNQLLTVYGWYKVNNEAGIGGYAEDIWDDSPTLYFVKQNSNFFPGKSIVYSNANEAVYLFSGKAVQSLPERVHVKIVEQFLNQKTFYVIWLNLSGNPDFINMEEIGRFKKIKPIITFNDGVIYRCSTL